MLLGRYAVTRELGSGAFARVLLANDTERDGMPVAIKVAGGELDESIRWEFSLLSSIAHPNVARVYELVRVPEAMPVLGLVRGQLLLVSELA